MTNIQLNETNYLRIDGIVGADDNGREGVSEL